MEDPHPMLPNRLVRIYLLSLEEILGENGVRAVLNMAQLSEGPGFYPPEDSAQGVSHRSFTQFQLTLETIYGERMGRNLARRASRQAFKQGLAELATDAPLSDKELPLSESVPRLIHSMTGETKQSIELVPEGDHIHLRVFECPNCVERHAKSPICEAFAGWVEAAFEAITDGERFTVAETQCIAVDSNFCEFSISRGSGERSPEAL